MFNKAPASSDSISKGIDTVMKMLDGPAAQIATARLTARLMAFLLGYVSSTVEKYNPLPFAMLVIDAAGKYSMWTHSTDKTTSDIEVFRSHLRKHLIAIDAVSYAYCNETFALEIPISKGETPQIIEADVDVKNHPDAKDYLILFAETKDQDCFMQAIPIGRKKRRLKLTKAPAPVMQAAAQSNFALLTEPQKAN